MPSSASELAIVSVAERKPVALGAKVTWKVVFPPPLTDAAGSCVTVKSAGFAPFTTTLGTPVSKRSAPPRF